MLVAALKCDLCNKTTEIKDGKSTKKILPQWGTMFTTIRVAGMTHREMNSNEFQKRKEILKSRFPTQHICPDCLMGIERGDFNIGIKPVNSSNLLENNSLEF